MVIFWHRNTLRLAVSFFFPISNILAWQNEIKAFIIHISSGTFYNIKLHREPKKNSVCWHQAPKTRQENSVQWADPNKPACTQELEVKIFITLKEAFSTFSWRGCRKSTLRSTAGECTNWYNSWGGIWQYLLQSHFREYSRNTQHEREVIYAWGYLLQHCFQ